MSAQAVIDTINNGGSSDEIANAIALQTRYDADDVALILTSLNVSPASITRTTTTTVSGTARTAQPEGANRAATHTAQHTPTHKGA